MNGSESEKMTCKGGGNMSEAVLVALITSGCMLVGNIIVSRNQSNRLSNDLQQQMEVHQAVTDTKIDELTREVREHNNFAQRMPVVENEIKHIEGDIKTLKGYHKVGATNG